MDDMETEDKDAEESLGLNAGLSGVRVDKKRSSIFTSGVQRPFDAFTL